jgi:hypothetical protein
MEGPEFEGAIRRFRPHVNLYTRQEPRIDRLAGELDIMLRQALIRLGHIVQREQSNSSSVRNILSHEGLIKFAPGSFQGPMEIKLQEFCKLNPVLSNRLWC